MRHVSFVLIVIMLIYFECQLSSVVTSEYERSARGFSPFHFHIFAVASVTNIFYSTDASKDIKINTFPT